jgi:hypothetical protein
MNIGDGKKEGGDQRTISTKLSMVVRKTLTFTTLEREEPAAARTAVRFLMQSSVICVMLEVGWVRISPVGVHGIWPEQ